MGLILAVCESCGRQFEARRAAKHCSAACTRAAYARRHLPSLRAAVGYLQREIARLENQVSGTRRRSQR